MFAREHVGVGVPCDLDDRNEQGQVRGKLVAHDLREDGGGVLQHGVHSAKLKQKLQVEG